MCEKCGFKPEKTDELDTHHIVNRKESLNGGYVPENGIALCSPCHIQAEKSYKTNETIIGYSTRDLYKIINSSFDIAIAKSKKLNK